MSLPGASYRNARCRIPLMCACRGAPSRSIPVSYTHLPLAHDCIIIVATHVVSDVEHVASEILLLKEGQLVDQASPAALIEKYAPGGTLEDVYLAIFGEDEA